MGICQNKDDDSNCNNSLIKIIQIIKDLTPTPSQSLIPIIIITKDLILTLITIIKGFPHQTIKDLHPITITTKVSLPDLLSYHKIYNINLYFVLSSYFYFPFSHFFLISQIYLYYHSKKNY